MPARALSASLPPGSKLPKAQPYRDEHFGNVAVYFDQVEIALPVTRRVTDAAKGALVLAAGLPGRRHLLSADDRRLAVSLPAGRHAGRGHQASGGRRCPRRQYRSGHCQRAPIAAAPAIDATASDAPPPGDAERPQPPQQQTRGLLGSLLLALLGGLILNLMPCVLPVLSLKALALAQAGRRASARANMRWLHRRRAAGSFAALGAGANCAKAGLALGWGFQLQQPVVVAVLALVVFAFGLSLSGLWYANVGIGQRGNALIRRAGGRRFLHRRAGGWCYALHRAVHGRGAGLCLHRPAAGGMLVFLMLGLGLALPFLLIGFRAGVRRLLPRPGAWMER